MGENPHSQNQLLNQYISKIRNTLYFNRQRLMSRLVKRRTYSYERLFYLILDGQGKITVNGEEFYPKKDDMVLLPKNSKGIAILRKRNLLQ